MRASGTAHMLPPVTSSIQVAGFWPGSSGCVSEGAGGRGTRVRMRGLQAHAQAHAHAHAGHA